MSLADGINQMAYPTVQDLEGIRRAAISYYQRERPAHADVFVDELVKGAIFLGETPAIGNWHFQEGGDGPELVRQPPISPTMHYFGLSLDRLGEQWSVRAQFHEIEHIEGDA